MSIFNVLTLIGGIALFLYGMELMGEGLTKTAGGKLEGILERLTNTVIKGVLLGAGVTAVIQASAATTVMVVGFVNSGIMNLNRRRNHNGSKYRNNDYFMDSQLVWNRRWFCYCSAF